LRCSLTPIATPVTVGIAVIARRPMTIFLGRYVKEGRRIMKTYEEV
jgi:O-antigen/teichoic acid export membrane protein